MKAYKLTILIALVAITGLTACGKKDSGSGGATAVTPNDTAPPPEETGGAEPCHFGRTGECNPGTVSDQRNSLRSSRWSGQLAVVDMEKYISFLDTFGYCTDTESQDWNRRRRRPCNNLSDTMNLDIYTPWGALHNYGQTAVKLGAITERGREIYATFPSNAYLNSDLGGFQTLYVSSQRRFRIWSEPTNPLYPPLGNGGQAEIAALNALQVVTTFTDGVDSNHSNLTVKVYFNGEVIAEGTMCSPAGRPRYGHGYYYPGWEWTVDWDQNWNREWCEDDFDNDDDYGYGGSWHWGGRYRWNRDNNDWYDQWDPSGGYYYYPRNSVSLQVGAGQQGTFLGGSVQTPGWGAFFQGFFGN